MVDKHGIRPDPDGVEAVLTWKSAKTEQQVMSFLGFANYYREFFERMVDKFIERMVDKYIERMVDKHGIRPDPDGLEAVLTWKSAKTEQQVMSFLGFANYYREFIKGYVDKVYPM